jgi:hypothetical protein
MKKNWNGCRALNGTSAGAFCDLQYKIENKLQPLGYYQQRPLEPCPKPKTYSQYLNCKKS